MLPVFLHSVCMTLGITSTDFSFSLKWFPSVVYFNSEGGDSREVCGAWG